MSASGKQRRAQNPEGVFNPNTSKKKIKAQERANQGPAIEGKLTPEQRAMLKQTGSLEQDQEPGQDEVADPTEHRAFSGDPERPFCRGRNYKPTRYGRKIDEIEEENCRPKEQLGTWKKVLLPPARPLTLP